MAERIQTGIAAKRTDDDPDGERHREALLDQALAESFPASDPPSIAWPPAKGR